MRVVREVGRALAAGVGEVVVEGGGGGEEGVGEDVAEGGPAERVEDENGPDQVPSIWERTKVCQSDFMLDAGDGGAGGGLTFIEPGWNVVLGLED